MNRETKADREARAKLTDDLRAILPRGTTVYCIVTRVARSGLSRNIRVLTVRKDKGAELQDISWLVGQVTGYRRADDSGLRISGGGMDMCFHLTSVISRALYGDDTSVRYDRNI